MTEKRFISKDESIINVVTDELVNASSEEGAKILVDWLNELVTKCNTLTDEKSKCECQLNRRTRQRDELAEFNVELMEKNKELKEINQDHQDHISLLEEEKINLQIKLQKIRDYAMENGEVKQDVIEKVVFE